MRAIQDTFLTPSEQVEHWHRWRAGDVSAGEKIYCSYERFIRKQAGKFARKFNGSQEDFFSSARAGFFEAMVRFDPSFNTTIGTYSLKWMRLFMQEDISYLLNAPTRNALAEKVTKEVNRLIRLNPAFNLPLTQIYKEAAGTLEMDPIRVQTLHERATRKTVSLTIPNYGDEGETIADNIADENVTDPLEAMQRDAVKTIIQEALEKLDSRSKNILKRRFGIAAFNQDEAENGVTLGAISDEYGLSKERIRQIEVEALKKLRSIIGKEMVLNTI